MYPQINREGDVKWQHLTPYVDRSHLLRPCLRNSTLLGSLVVGLFVGGCQYEIKSARFSSLWKQLLAGNRRLDVVHSAIPYQQIIFLQIMWRRMKSFDFNFSVKETRQVGSLVTVFGNNYIFIADVCII